VITIVRRRRPVGQVAALAATALLALLGQKLIDIWLQNAGARLAFLGGWLGAVLVVGVCAALAYLWLRRERHATDLEVLVARMGIEVRYYPIPANDGERALFRKFSQVNAWDAALDAIDGVTSTESVIVVRYMRMGPAGDEQTEAARKRYLSSLEQLMRRVMVYQILQIPPDEWESTQTIGLEHLLHPAMLDHLRAAAHVGEATTDHRGGCQVDMVKALYPISFVLIHNPQDRNRGRVLWEMVKHEADRGGFVSCGLFIIDDATGVIIETFLNWSRELAARAN
jgi:hypothetical protein